MSLRGLWCAWVGHSFRQPFPGTADDRAWCEDCGAGPITKGDSKDGAR